jgi:glycosyltransferase involved in cell wall biosynthesis
MKVLLSAFQCNESGVSESYLGYRWFSGLSKLCDLTLVTGDEIASDNVITPYKHWDTRFGLIAKVNAAVKFDYFLYNYFSGKTLRDQVANFNVVHHVSPVAPRYPVSIAKYSQKFILGPVAGGLRVPKFFQKEVEGSEEIFFQLRKLDNFRLRKSKSLIETYNRADKIVIAGDYLKELLPEKYHHKCVKMLDVGIDTSQYKFVNRIQGVDSFNLLYVGRVVPYKGLIYLLKAIAALPHQVRNFVKLDIAGNQSNNEYELLCKKFINMN